MKECHPHILLVEDDAALSQTLVETLATHLPALKVTAAYSVEQAWRTLEEGQVTLVVTDLHLPGIPGDAFIQRIRERGWRGPVVVMSGHGLEQVSEVREMLQISALLAKPFDTISFVGAISAALKGVPNACCNERR